MPPDPPLLLAAIYDISATELTLTYDRPLQAGPLGLNNIEVRVANNRRQNTAPGVIAGTTVTVIMDNLMLDLGPDIVDYFATPPQIATPTGGLAAAFLNFPLPTVP